MMRYLPLLLTTSLAMVGCTPKSTEVDFASLSGVEKGKFVWHLFDRDEFGKPEHKEICRDLLATQGSYVGANHISFLSDAMDLAEKEGWKEMRPLVEAISKRPKSVWTLERSLRWLRKADGKPVSKQLIKAVRTIARSGDWKTRVTDEQLLAAKGRLFLEKDEDVTIVYAFLAATWTPGKGGNNRGRWVGVEVLRSLNKQKVQARLKQFLADFGDFEKSLVEWVKLGLEAKAVPVFRPQAMED